MSTTFSKAKKTTTPPGVRKGGPGPADYVYKIPVTKIHPSMSGKVGLNIQGDSPRPNYMPPDASSDIGPFIHGKIGTSQNSGDSPGPNYNPSKHDTKLGPTMGSPHSPGNSPRPHKQQSTTPSVSTISGNKMKVIPVDLDLIKVLDDSGGKILESNDTAVLKLEGGSGNSGDLNRHCSSSEEEDLKGSENTWVKFEPTSGIHPGGSCEITRNFSHTTYPLDNLASIVFPKDSPNNSIRNQSSRPAGNPQCPDNTDENARVGSNGTGNNYQSPGPAGNPQSPDNRQDGNIIKRFENVSIIDENIPPPIIIERGEDMWTNVDVDPTFPPRRPQPHTVVYRDPKWAPLSLVYLGIIIALVCTITGLLQAVLERSPWHSIFAGIFQMILGMFAVMLEASQISPEKIQTNSKRFFNIVLRMNRKPFYAKSAFYVVTGIIPLAVYSSWATGLGSGGIILLGLIYLIYTLFSRD